MINPLQSPVQQSPVWESEKQHKESVVQWDKGQTDRRKDKSDREIISTACCFSFHCPVSEWREGQENKTYNYYLNVGEKNKISSPARQDCDVISRLDWTITQILWQSKQLPLCFTCSALIQHMSLLVCVYCAFSFLLTVMYKPFFFGRHSQQYRRVTLFCNITHWSIMLEMSLFPF